MSAQSRRLLTAFLAVSIVLSTVCLPVGAAVKPGQQMPACSGPENISGDLSLWTGRKNRHRLIFLLPNGKL